MTISSVASVCLAVHVEQLSCHWTDFVKFDDSFWKSVKEFQVSLKSDKNNWILYMMPHVICDNIFAEFLLEWVMFLTKVVEKIHTHILYPVPFSPKIVPLWNNVEKYMADPDRPQMTI